MSEQPDINQAVTGTEYAATSGSGSAAIYITNYYYREDTKVVPVESTGTLDEQLPCPYRGLFHFSPNDAEYFFGREVFIEELFAATQTRSFIPVLGASGSGKSSVVLAGLVPKLQNEGHWLFTHFRPGSDPFHALALALVPLYTLDLDATERIAQARKLAKYLHDGDVPLADVFAQIHQNHPTDRVLLIVDQFEELYTLCVDQKVRRSFLDTLLTSFESSPSQSQYNYVLVATMRVDFLGNALSYPQFGELLRNADIKIRSMNREELTKVIVKPTDKLGVTFQEGLVERILDDVEDEPGSLPLLEFALTELWKRRTGKYLTHAAYQEIGEVQGALASYADKKYRELTINISTEKIRRIFIQLVRPGEGMEDTRRLATKSELGEVSWGLVKQLADARLVVTGRNAEDQEIVEVVHEALIHHWCKLRQWMNIYRNFRVWQEGLRFAMRQWEHMQRDEGALLRGAALEEAEEKFKQQREHLSIEDQEFIKASLALRDKERFFRERQQRQTVTLWLFVLIMTIGLIFIIGFQLWRLSALRKVDEDIKNLKGQIKQSSLIKGTEDFVIYKIAVTNKIIWMAAYKKSETRESVLLQYNLKTKKLISHPNLGEIQELFAKEEEVFFGSKDKGVFYGNNKNDKRQFSFKLILKMDSQEIYGLVKDNKESLWIGNEQGIYRYYFSGTSKHISQIYPCTNLPELEKKSLEKSSTALGITQIVMDTDKDVLWIATLYGLMHWSRKDNQLKYYCRENQNTSIAKYGLTTLDFVLQERLLAVGDQSGHVSLIFKGLDTPDSAENDVVKEYPRLPGAIMDLLILPQQSLLVAIANTETPVYVLYYSDSNNYEWSKINISKEKFQKVYDIVVGKDKHLWIGTERGVYKSRDSIIK